MKLSKSNIKLSLSSGALVTFRRANNSIPECSGIFMHVWSQSLYDLEQFSMDTEYHNQRPCVKIAMPFTALCLGKQTYKLSDAPFPEEYMKREFVEHPHTDGFLMYHYGDIDDDDACVREAFTIYKFLYDNKIYWLEDYVVENAVRKIGNFAIKLHESKKQ